MKKRLIGLLLTIAIMIMFVVPTFACTPPLNPPSSPKIDFNWEPSDEMKEAIKNYVDKFLEEHPIDYSKIKTSEAETEIESDTELESEFETETDVETTEIKETEIETELLESEEEASFDEEYIKEESQNDERLYETSETKDNSSIEIKDNSKDKYKFFQFEKLINCKMHVKGWFNTGTRIILR